jgi:glycosyltransferase involved in cell wall biosynthesis
MIQGFPNGELTLNPLKALAGLARKRPEDVLPLVGPLNVVVRSYNCADWLPKCLESIAAQDYPCRVCVVDDASDDPRQPEIISLYCDRHGWLKVVNPENRGVTYSMVVGIRAMDLKDEDVIVLIDGDDWLCRNDALTVIARAYTDPNVLLTYGSYVNLHDGTRGVCRRSPRRVTKNRSYREHRWIYSAPRTFRYVLWRNIKDQDLRDENGEYYREASDQAAMFPMLEMSGGRFKFIRKILYVYNCACGANVHTHRRAKQIDTEMKIRGKDRYEPLDIPIRS